MTSQQQQPQQQSAPFATPGRLGWAALILGLGSVGFCWIPILNIIAMGFALIAFTLGVIALFLNHTRPLAAVGVAASILTWIAASAVNGAFADELNQGSGTVSGTSVLATTPAAGQPEPTKEIPTWGQTFTWANGVAIKVDGPVPCTPSRASSLKGKPRAVAVNITVINGSKEDFQTAVLSVGTDVQYEGVKAETILDFIGDGCGDGSFNSSTVLPGQSFSYIGAYAVGDGPGRLQLTFRSTFGAENATFVGPA